MVVPFDGGADRPGLVMRSLLPADRVNAQIAGNPGNPGPGSLPVRRFQSSMLSRMHANLRFLIYYSPFTRYG